ncbi:MAG: molecular chaperone HtpG [Gammaproteobacteria bacterium]|nr:molecular chaperone HtpG [Gammaproteobacteria bacterium]
MSVEAKKETMEFQAEVQQLLKLMIHSMYSNKEIFVRELVSNASDACDKLRFEALAKDDLYEGDGDLKIRVAFDKDANTVTISDNGIGMDRDELIANIGTIANSGTKKFMEALSTEQVKDAEMIGQFGVGFYSSFIVADKITVETRRAGAAKNEGYRWESDGEGSYSIETIEKEGRGTDIILHLREEDKEFADGYRLRAVIRKYSDHISLPIVMQKDAEPVADDADEKVISEPEDETVNSASALWTRAKSEITEDEYKEFYKHISHDFEEPLKWIHNRVEGTQDYTSLLYIPKKAPFDLWDREQRKGIKLYVKRVFIMDDSEHLMPNYLRFVRGVIDSDDLPLNVSREILQQNKVIDTIRGASVKKVLGMLEKMSKNEAEEYAGFWATFGQVLKEGVIEDFMNKDKVAALLRFSSTETGSPEQTVSLADYIGRMKEGQEKIYYIVAESHAAAKNSPHLELLKSKGMEVLLLSDRVDEWLVAHLTEFDGKQLVSVTRGDLDLGETDSKEKKEALEKAQGDFKDVIEKMKGILADDVKDVRMSSRLTDSPSCLIVDDQDMTAQMQQILKAAGQNVPVSKPILELNPEHALITQLKNKLESDDFSEWTNVLFDQAALTGGAAIRDTAEFVKRVNKLLVN